MPTVIVAVCEADADSRIASQLTDRLLCEEVEWIEREHLDAFRSFKGPDSVRAYLKWTSIRDLSRELGIRAHGHFEGSPAEHDGQAARRALLIVERLRPEAKAVYLIRDDDRDHARRTGLQQARRESKSNMSIVIGLAHPLREAWVLAGFTPQGEAEQHLLSELRRELGFNPCEHAERLTAKHDNDKLSAKRVLRKLTSENHDREAACWRETPLQTMRDRGNETGLAAFIKEVEDRIPPLLGRT
jgi:hypothetical protein